MRGKQASAAARRREQSAKIGAAALRTQAEAERARLVAENKELRNENARLRSEHAREAGVIAAAEVERILAEKEAERARRGISDDIVTSALHQKDRLVRNACRYISMTTGQGPYEALGMVLTWQTDKPFHGLPTPDRAALILGVPQDGWVGHIVARASRTVERAFAQRGASAQPLDYVAEHPDEFTIHPGYKPRWYPKLDYGSSWMDQVDELETETGDAA